MKTPLENDKRKTFSGSDCWWSSISPEFNNEILYKNRGCSGPTVGNVGLFAVVRDNEACWAGLAGIKQKKQVQFLLMAGAGQSSSFQEHLRRHTTIHSFPTTGDLLLRLYVGCLVA
jgi:hypothetical protein